MMTDGVWESFSDDCAQDGVVWHEESVKKNQAEGPIGGNCKGKTPPKVNH